jgi:hypothetical protein
MTLRQPHQPALLTSDEVAFIRKSLIASSDLLAWISRNGGEHGRALLTEASWATAGKNTPGHLAYDVNLAIDYLDFAPGAGRNR